MEQKSIPMPAVAALITLAVLVVGFFLYRTVTGGTVGTGEAGSVHGSPPGQQQAIQGGGQKTP